MSMLQLERSCYEEFIDCYKRHPELWDHTREDYSHRCKKERAYAELLKILRKINPQAGDLEVRCKINSFRSSYRRERRKKMRLREKYGGILPKSEEPTLWYYDTFKFLDPILDNPQKKTPNESTWMKPEDSLIANTRVKSPVYSEENSMEEDPFSSNSYNFVDVSSASPTEMKPYNQSNVQSRDRKSSHVEREPTTSTASFNQSRDEDPAEIYGRAWSLQFKQLTNDQKIFAKKAIDDILFEASLGTLRRHSVKINDSLCQHCQTTFLNNEYDDQVETLPDDV